MMNRRREMLLKKSGGILPTDFEELNYIVASQQGGTYIDTGIKHDGDIRLVFKCTFLNSGTSDATQRAFFGSTPASGKSNWLLSGTSGHFDSLQYNYWGIMVQRYGVRIDNFDSRLPHIYDVSNNLIIDDMLISSTAQSAEMSTSGGTTISIFAHHGTNGYIREAFGKSKIYFVKIYKGSVLVRDYIPCKRKSDAVCGLYDLVTSNFFVSSGNNNFTEE